VGGLGAERRRLVLYVSGLPFASVDWVMSLEPRWYPTIYGMLFIVGQALWCVSSIMALIGSPIGNLSRSCEAFVCPGPGEFSAGLRDALGISGILAVPDHLGRNLSEEIPWYIRRMQGTGASRTGCSSC